MKSKATPKSAYKMRTLRVLHVTPAALPDTSWGGPVYAIDYFSRCTIADGQFDVEILTASCKRSQKLALFPRSRADRLCPKHADVPVKRCKVTIGRSFSLSQLLHLVGSVRNADVVHLSFFYSPIVIPTLLMCRALDKPVIWMLHGAQLATETWGSVRRRRLKRLYGMACARLFKRGWKIHATSANEAYHAEKLFGANSACIIPIGVDMPAHPPEPIVKEHPIRIVFVGRIDPVKGLEELIAAVGLCERDLKLSIFGDGDPDYVSHLKKLALEHGAGTSIMFHGWLEENRKDQEIGSADVLVLPSHSENFGFVVLEALSRGVPVIASKQTPWMELQEFNCGYWIENDRLTLADTLNKLDQHELHVKGERGRLLVNKRYSSNAVRELLAQQYRTLAKE